MKTNIISLPTAARKPKISVIMVSFMTGPALYEAVNAVLQDPDIYELIIVDNGNMPAARHRLSELIFPYDKVRLLQGHGNIGFAKACNYGASLAMGDHFLFLNPDAVIAPGAAANLADCAESLTRPWIAGGLLRDVHGAEQRGGRRRALTPLSAFVTFTGLHKLPGFKPIHMESEPLPAGPMPVETISGAFFMMDRTSFEHIGGFDERYFLHVEDIEICKRTRDMGGEIVYVSKATAMHYGRTSEAPPLQIERKKLEGFIIYFWNYSDKKWAKLAALLSIPFISVAILGRAWLLAVRKGLLGR